MNSNKINCQKYVSLNSLLNSSPILEFSVKLASQICHENINKPLDGAYLADFGRDITLNKITLHDMYFEADRNKC